VQVLKVLQELECVGEVEPGVSELLTGRSQDLVEVVDALLVTGEQFLLELNDVHLLGEFQYEVKRLAELFEAVILLILNLYDSSTFVEVCVHVLAFFTKQFFIFHTIVCCL